jgi:hypothetical protein
MALTLDFTFRNALNGAGLGDAFWSTALSKFVAIQGIDVAHAFWESADGVTWTANATTSTQVPVRLVYNVGLGLFVAIGIGALSNETVCWSSTDGTTWTRTVDTSSISQRMLATSEDLGQFIAGGVGANVFHSTDGHTWTLGSQIGTGGGTFASAVNDAAWSPSLGIYCATIEKTTTDHVTATSPDGVTWTAHTWTGHGALTLGATPWGRIDWSPTLGLFCMVGKGGTATSPDGSTWTLVDSSLAGIGTKPYIKWMDGAGGAGAFVFAEHSPHGPLAWSSDLGLLVTDSDTVLRHFKVSVDGSAWTTVDAAAMSAGVMTGVFRTIFIGTGPLITMPPTQVATPPIPSTVSLAATVDTPATYTETGVTWSQDSGPSTPAISSPSSLTTDVVFSSYAPGTYVFRLTVHGQNATTGEPWPDVSATTIIVVPEPVAPRVTSDSLRTVYPAGVTVNPTVVDDGWNGSVTYAWTQVSGPGAATIVSPTSENTDIDFPNLAGIYLFKLTASNDALSGSGVFRVIVFTSASGGGFDTELEDIADTTITVGGVPFVALVNTPTITEQLNDSPSTCSFKVFGVIDVGADVVITRNSERIFGGTVLSTSKTADEQLENLFTTVSVIGYEWQLTRKRFTNAYTNESASSIAADIISGTAFTGDYIAADLPTVTDIEFISATRSEALSALAKQIGGHWNSDYFKKIHFAIVDEAKPAPTPLTEFHPSMYNLEVTEDLSQTVSRVIVKGKRASTTTTVSAAGELQVDSLAGYNLSGGTVNIGGRSVTYTGTRTARKILANVEIGTLEFLPTTRDDGHLAGSFNGSYAVTAVTKDGESLPIASWSGSFNLTGTDNAIKLTWVASDSGVQVYFYDGSQFLGPYPVEDVITHLNIYRVSAAPEDTGDNFYLVASLLPRYGVVYDTVTAQDLIDNQAPLMPLDDHSGPVQYFLTGITDTTVTSSMTDYEVVVNDTAAQAALAALFGGGDDGVIEGVIDAGTVSEADAHQAGLAFLQQHSSIGLAVRYTTRDQLTHAGCIVTVDLPAPWNIAVDCLIHQVTTSQFEHGVPLAYAVSATANVPLTHFEKLLGNVAGSTVISGSSASSGGTGGGAAVQGPVGAQGIQGIQGPPGVVQQVHAGTGITVGGTLADPVVDLADTAVTPGSYTNADVTIDAQGRVTAAANGSAGGVTTTGTPAAGNLTKFSGAATITNGDLSGDVSTSGALVTTIANDAVTNAKAANMAQATIKGRAAGAGTGDPTDLTGTQATAILNNVVGDSGAGGTKGLVPAPGAGDAAAGKFLKADGTFAVPSGGLSVAAVMARIALGV